MRVRAVGAVLSCCCCVSQAMGANHPNRHRISSACYGFALSLSVLGSGCNIFSSLCAEGGLAAKLDAFTPAQLSQSVMLFVRHQGLWPIPEPFWLEPDGKPVRFQRCFCGVSCPCLRATGSTSANNLAWRPACARSPDSGNVSIVLSVLMATV